MKNILNINERILYIIENQYNDNKKKFAESIGYSAQVIFNIVSGRKNNPSFEVLNAIISTNADISSEWLLTGEGKMLKKENEPQNILNDPGESYGPDYKEMYAAAKYTIEVQKKYIESLESQLGIKRNAG